MEIRNVKAEDAEAFLKMLLQLDTETKNMMYEPGERSTDIERLRNRIPSGENQGDLLIGSFLDEEMVGFLSVSRGEFIRIRHRAYIVIGILQKGQSRGLGSLMFQQLMDWAVSKGITRLELTVMSHNKAAIALYKKFGFEIEGIKRHSLIVDGNYVDEYYMAKLLEARNI